MGSKFKYAKEIIPIILKNRKPEQFYVEPFVGGCNIIEFVDGNRIGSDNNPYLIAMWKALQSGWIPPEITKEEYINARDNKEAFSPELIGWIGFTCSFRGKFFNGFAAEVKIKNKERTRNYQQEARKNVFKQIPKIQNVTFICEEYFNLKIPDNSIIYCDPPYKGTTEYHCKFNHDDFWQWCENMVQLGHGVYVSEYSAPNNWNCVWEKSVKSSLSGEWKNSTERLWSLK